eukprot:6968608-Lingulodinium_polyedra.AAC.1
MPPGRSTAMMSPGARGRCRRTTRPRRTMPARIWASRVPGASAIHWHLARSICTPRAAWRP